MIICRRIGGERNVDSGRSLCPETRAYIIRAGNGFSRGGGITVGELEAHTPNLNLSRFSKLQNTRGAGLQGREKSGFQERVASSASRARAKTRRAKSQEEKALNATRIHRATRKISFFFLFFFFVFFFPPCSKRSVADSARCRARFRLGQIESESQRQACVFTFPGACTRVTRASVRPAVCLLLPARCLESLDSKPRERRRRSRQAPSNHATVSQRPNCTI